MGPFLPSVHSDFKKEQNMNRIQKLLTVAVAGATLSTLGAFSAYAAEGAPSSHTAQVQAKRNSTAEAANSQATSMLYLRGWFNAGLELDFTDSSGKPVHESDWGRLGQNISLNYPTDASSPIRAKVTYINGSGQSRTIYHTEWNPTDPPKCFLTDGIATSPRSSETSCG